ncbi:MAG: hypothetical protein ACPG1C_08740 [Alphaproteobacteria bacterium]
MTLFGKVENNIPFTVVADPASVYFNFRIKPEQLEAFTRYINLPAGMELSPIQILEGEAPEYILTANIYEVTGLTKGLRCEWSTYIRDAQGIPRYLIVEARASKRSMDPMDFVTPKSRVEHAMTDEAITSVVESEDGKLLTTTIHRKPDAPIVRADGEWIEANDYIYWRNGVIDKTYYGAGFAKGMGRLHSLENVEIDDQTHWAQFIESAPKHVFQCEEALNFSVVMWSNV